MLVLHVFFHVCALLLLHGSLLLQHCVLVSVVGLAGELLLLLWHEHLLVVVHRKRRLLYLRNVGLLIVYHMHRIGWVLLPRLLVLHHLLLRLPDLDGGLILVGIGRLGSLSGCLVMRVLSSLIAILRFSKLL